MRQSKANVPDEVQEKFLDFSSKYQRNYKSMSEYNKRLNIFQKNYQKVQEHNLKKAATEGFYMELNKFADMTEEEFEQMLGNIPEEEKRSEDQEIEQELSELT